jgi:hypothetical protein
MECLDWNLNLTTLDGEESLVAVVVHTDTLGDARVYLLGPFAVLATRAIDKEYARVARGKYATLPTSRPFDIPKTY